MEGEIIRDEIRGFLKKKGYKTSDANVETIFAEHLNDPTDMHLMDLIDSRSYLID